MNTSLIIKDNITDNDYLLGILPIAIKYNHTYEEIIAYTKFTDSTFVCSQLPRSKYMLWKLLQRNDVAYRRHYFCKYCRSAVGSNAMITKTCPCKKTGPKSNIKTVPYFLAIDLRMQISESLNIPHILTALVFRFTRKTDSNAMTEIYYGMEYKKLCSLDSFCTTNGIFLTFLTQMVRHA